MCDRQRLAAGLPQPLHLKAAESGHGHHSVHEPAYSCGHAFTGGEGITIQACCTSANIDCSPPLVSACIWLSTGGGALDQRLLVAGLVSARHGLGQLDISQTAVPGSHPVPGQLAKASLAFVLCASAPSSA